MEGHDWTGPGRGRRGSGGPRWSPARDEAGADAGDRKAQQGLGAAEPSACHQSQFNLFMGRGSAGQTFPSHCPGYPSRQMRQYGSPQARFVPAGGGSTTWRTFNYHGEYAVQEGRGKGGPKGGKTPRQGFVPFTLFFWLLFMPPLSIGFYDLIPAAVAARNGKGA